MLQQNRQALVVEGGGMRGAFTSGVLDAFLHVLNKIIVTFTYSDGRL